MAITDKGVSTKAAAELAGRQAEIDNAYEERAWKASESRKGRTIKKKEIGASENYNKAFNKQSTAGLLSSRLSLAIFLKPLIVGFLVLLFLIGPGLSAISVIFGSMQWYLWVGAIVVGIYIFKYR